MCLRILVYPPGDQPRAHHHGTGFQVRYRGEKVATVVLYGIKSDYSEETSYFSRIDIDEGCIASASKAIATIERLIADRAKGTVDHRHDKHALNEAGASLDEDDQDARRSPVATTIDAGQVVDVDMMRALLEEAGRAQAKLVADETAIAVKRGVQLATADMIDFVNQQAESRRLQVAAIVREIMFGPGRQKETRTLTTVLEEIAAVRHEIATLRASLVAELDFRVEADLREKRAATEKDVEPPEVSLPPTLGLYCTWDAGILELMVFDGVEAAKTAAKQVPTRQVWLLDRLVGMMSRDRDIDFAGLVEQALLAPGTPTFAKPATWSKKS